MEDFVYIDEYGLMGSNFYWQHRHKVAGTTNEDLIAVGLVNDRVQVHKDIVPVLVKIDRLLQEKEMRLYVKEGYRAKALYELVYKKRVELFGQEATDRILNMKDIPHASGKTVDVALWDIKTDKEIYLRDGKDGDDAYFANFYKNKTTEEAKHYQELQDFTINLMQDHGFRLGTKLEYFHFNYDPKSPRNY